MSGLQILGLLTQEDDAQSHAIGVVKPDADFQNKQAGDRVAFLIRVRALLDGNRRRATARTC